MERKTVKVYEMYNTITTWYTLQNIKDDHNNMVFNQGCEEVALPLGYKLGYAGDNEAYIFHNGYTYNIHKGKTGYLLYPSVTTLKEAYDNKQIVYI